MIIDESTYLEHYGVKGMRWGVRRNRRLQTQSAREDKRTRKGKQISSLAKESQRIQDAGGGLSGTLKVRREMIKAGELSKAQAKSGRRKMARNLTIALAGGAAVGVALTMGGSKTISSLSAPSNQVFSARGKDFVLEYGTMLYPSTAKLFG